MVYAKKREYFPDYGKSVILLGMMMAHIMEKNVEFSAAGVCLCYFAVTAATIALTYLWDKHRKQNKI